MNQADALKHIPTDDDDARRSIIGLMRIKCPHGFMTADDAEKRSKLTSPLRSKIRQWARAFPKALNLPDIDGRTALAWLVRYDEPGLIEEFLNLGAHARRCFGSDHRRAIHPLHQAVELGHGKALALIAEAAGVEDMVIACERKTRDAPNPCCGTTALFMAAYCCNCRGIATLLEMGANTEASGQHGDTPMHALGYGKKNLIRALPCIEILNLASPRLILRKNHAGFTPADVAQANQSDLAAPLRALQEAAELRIQTDLSDPLKKTAPRL